MIPEALTEKGSRFEPPRIPLVENEKCRDLQESQTSICLRRSSRESIVCFRIQQK
jgi:hypothetical protein